MRALTLIVALATLAFLVPADAFAAGALVPGAAGLPNFVPFASVAAAIASGHLPRAIIGRPWMNTDPAAALAQITAGLADFKARFGGRVDAVEAAVDDISRRAAYGRLGDPSGGMPDDPEYSKLFASFLRSGDGAGPLREANATGMRRDIHAAMQTGSDGAGGYLAPAEWDRNILKAQVATSPFRQLATVVTTNQRAFSTLWAVGAPGSGWVGETASRPATSTQTFAPIVIPAGEIYANPQATQGILDDSAINLEAWMGGEVGTEFARQEGIAFVSGDGVNKPQGFLTYAPGAAAAAVHPGGALGVTVSGSMSEITADGLTDAFYGLAAPYRQNATWLMSSDTARQVAKLKDGSGAYLWRDAFIAGQPATLLGRPVAYDENMPAAGAGNLAAAIGDFAQGYIVNDRVGTRVLRDPFTNKPYVGFYTTRRVGGGLRDPKAIRLLKIAAS